MTWYHGLSNKFSATSTKMWRVVGWPFLIYWFQKKSKPTTLSYMLALGYVCVDQWAPIGLCNQMNLHGKKCT